MAKPHYQAFNKERLHLGEPLADTEHLDLEEPLEEATTTDQWKMEVGASSDYTKTANEIQALQKLLLTTFNRKIEILRLEP